jgi:hypothetical protein
MQALRISLEEERQRQQGGDAQGEGMDVAQDAAPAVPAIGMDAVSAGVAPLKGFGCF